MSDRNPADLCPELQGIYKQWKINCSSAGLSVTAIVTWRSPSEQNLAMARGLSHAAFGKSPHNCVDKNGKPASKAFDFAVFDGTQYITDGTDRRYAQAAQIGKDLGLVWGGDWTIEKDHCNPDWDHLQMLNWKQSS